MKQNHSYIYNKVKSMTNMVMLFIGITLLGACDAENSISTTYPCKFIFYTNLHPGTDIETALNGSSTYVMVSAQRGNGTWTINTRLNDGKDKTNHITLTTAKENYADYSYLGAGNNKDATKNGFILGTTNFSGYTAWDRQCPNCIISFGGTNYPLEWTGNRQSVICAKCKRVYSLETGAITSGGQSKDDKPLMRYQVSYGGIGSILKVGN